MTVTNSTELNAATEYHCPESDSESRPPGPGGPGQESGRDGHEQTGRQGSESRVLGPARVTVTSRSDRDTASGWAAAARRPVRGSDSESHGLSTADVSHTELSQVANIKFSEYSSKSSAAK